MKMHPLSLIGLMFTMVFSLESFSTSFFIRPFSEFTESATHIIRGKPSDVHTEHGVTPDGKTIFTYANLQITEVIKGDITGSQITIRKVGGTKDGVTLAIPSSVEFVEGEDAVFYLGPAQSDHSYEVTGMELGKFHLTLKNGEEILTGGLFAYSHDSHGDEHVQSANTDENKKPWSLNQLKELVRSQGGAHTQPTISVSPTPSVELKSPTNSETSETNTGLNHLSDNTSQEKNETSLYFTKEFWYAVSTLILILAFFILRRR